MATTRPNDLPPGARERPRPRIIAFLDPAQVPLIRAVAAAVDVELVGAGSPVKGQSGGVAAELACPAVDDLRSVLTDGACDAVLVASPGDFGAAEGSAGVDARAVQAAYARGVGVASLEPLPASALDVRGVWNDSQAGLVAAAVPRFVGLPRRLRAFRDAAEPLEQFGPARFLVVESLARPEEGSLAARMMAACHTVVSLMGEPEVVDAAYVSTAAGGRIAPADTLVSLRGDLTAMMRFSDGRAAAIAASSQGARWGFGATLLGPEGRIRVHHMGFSWRAADGSLRDELRLDEARESPAYASNPHEEGLFGVLREPSAPSASHQPAVDALSESLSRILDPDIPDEGPIELETVLCVMQAAMLSARTGQPERPQMFRNVSVGGL